MLNLKKNQLIRYHIERLQFLKNLNSLKNNKIPKHLKKFYNKINSTNITLNTNSVIKSDKIHFITIIKFKLIFCCLQILNPQAQNFLNIIQKNIYFNIISIIIIY